MEGCIDETACNYDETATIQAYGNGQLTITWVEFGSYAGEISWEIVNAEGAIAASGDANAAIGLVLDLPAGDYTFNGYDSYGDGWNGFVLGITDAGSGASQTTLDDGGVHQRRLLLWVHRHALTQPMNRSIATEIAPTVESCTNLTSVTNMLTACAAHTEKAHTPSW